MHGEDWLCNLAEQQAPDFFLLDTATGKPVWVNAGFGAGS
jgi:hypothetical protein